MWASLFALLPASVVRAVCVCARPFPQVRVKGNIPTAGLNALLTVHSGLWSGMMGTLFQEVLKPTWPQQLDSFASTALLALMVAQPTALQALVGQLLASQPPAMADRLQRAFSALMAGITLDVTVDNQRLFQEHFENFLADVFGFGQVK